jgi:hypothetical protein
VTFVGLAAVVGPHLVGQVDLPTGGAGAVLPVGLLAIDEELFVETADGVPGVPVDCKAGAAEVAVDVLLLSRLPTVQM